MEESKHLGANGRRINLIETNNRHKDTRNILSMLPKTSLSFIHNPRREQRTKSWKHDKTRLSWSAGIVTGWKNLRCDHNLEAEIRALTDRKHVIIHYTLWEGCQGLPVSPMARSVHTISRQGDRVSSYSRIDLHVSRHPARPLELTKVSTLAELSLSDQIQVICDAKWWRS